MVYYIDYYDRELKCWKSKHIKTENKTVANSVAENIFMRDGVSTRIVKKTPKGQIVVAQRLYGTEITEE